MRKIETQIINAVRDNQDLKVANSQVVTYTNCSDVYLHGNLIARIGETWIELFDGGYQSKTTKSRLNALLQAFGMDGEYVFQKNFQWFVNYNGSPIPFFSGMRLAWIFLTLTNNKTMNRTELQESYIQQVIDSMDYKTMERFVYDNLQDNLQGYSDEELIAEVEEYYPELLEDWIMTSTYCIASNLSSRTYEWYNYIDGKVFQYNTTPVPFTSVQIAGFYASLFNKVNHDWNTLSIDISRPEYDIKLLLL